MPYSEISVMTANNYNGTTTSSSTEQEVDDDLDQILETEVELLQLD